MARLVSEVRRCVWGEGVYQSAAHHDEVLTAADNPEDFDHRVLGGTPNDYQYGYCARCKQPMRWSVGHQRWLEWDLNPNSVPKSPPHPHDVNCTGLAATFCDIHGDCFCGRCCLILLRPTAVLPKLEFTLEGATVEVNMHVMCDYDLNDPHCPLHGLD